VLFRSVRFEAAAADMSAVAASIERDNPSTNQDLGAALVPLRDDLIVADVRSTTLVLFAAVALLLLIATANVSGLLMARAAGRSQEIAIRAALGASRGRIVAQLLTESILLALVGGAGGVLIALWLVPAIVTLSPTDLTIAGPVAINRGVLVFGLIASTASGVLFGLAPARQLTRADINEELKQAGRGTSGNQRRLRAAIVGAEVALSLVLLVAAGLTVRSFLRLQQVPIGFDPDRVVTFRLAPSATRYRTATQRADFWERTLTAVSHVPDLESVAVVSRLPLLAGNSSRGIVVPGLPAGVQPVADYRTSSPGYFRIMGIPLLRGRDFAAADRDGRPLVAILTKLTADRYWPGRDPIGRTFKINDPGPDYTIVGIVGDIRAFSLDEAPRPMIYVPYRQDPFFSMAFVMRHRGVPGVSRATTTSDAIAALQPSIRAAIWTVDKEQAVGALQSMDDQISNSLARRRFSVTLLTGFGGVAMMLAAVGLYGVLAFVVSQRRREIGVRIALGATARDVIVDVLGEGMRLAGIGMICGLVLSVAVTRVMSSLLFGTSPTDVVAFAGAATLLTAIAIVASAVPALRASRVDPLVALRDE